MMLYTIGYAQKSAKQFFELIEKNNISLLLDVRLHNKSQLAGFSKGADLAYFLDKLCHCDYAHDICFAPTDDILKDYRNKKITWASYQDSYLKLVETRHCETKFQEVVADNTNVCLLCSEPTADFCHRRLLAEYLSDKLEGVQVKHL